ncbi:MAG: SRPBCC domain-containing protein [Candidatus Nanopelagicales bacterium]
MLNIVQRIGVKDASPESVYNAVATVEGLAAWWTEDTTGSASEVGGVIAFRFPPGGFDMEVIELEPAKRIVWKVIDGPPEWIDTVITWELSEEDGYTIVMFRHDGWREQDAFMAHCTTKWATYLMSLKRLVETGTGEPSPNDVMISNWH